MILHRSGADGRLIPLSKLVWFLGGAVVVGPLVGAAIGAIGTTAEFGNSWLDVFVKWWAGDGLGVLVVAPLLLCVREVRAPRRSSVEVLALATVAVAVPLLAFPELASRLGHRPAVRGLSAPDVGERPVRDPGRRRRRLRDR